MDGWDDDPRPAVGLVLDADRGSLPYAAIHGESLVACAAWALGQAEVGHVDAVVPWAELREAGRTLVLHDSLCPMTPPEFIADCVAACEEQDTVVVAVRPVTDTVKVIRDGVVGETVDRDGLLALASPVVIPEAVVAQLEAAPVGELTQLVAGLAQRFSVVTVEAPPAARRVASLDDVRLLEALTSA